MGRRRPILLILDIFRPNFEEDHHNFAGIDIRAKHAQSNLYIVEIDNAAD